MFGKKKLGYSTLDLFKYLHVTLKVWVGNQHAKLKIKMSKGYVKLLDNSRLLTCYLTLDQTEDLVSLSCLVLTVTIKFKLIFNDYTKITLILGTLNGHINACRVNHVITMTGVIWTKMQDFVFVWVEFEHPGYCL